MPNLVVTLLQQVATLRGNLLDTSQPIQPVYLRLAVLVPISRNCMVETGSA